MKLSEPYPAFLAFGAGILTLFSMSFFLFRAYEQKELQERFRNEPARIVSTMSLEQKVGHLFHAGLLGKNASPWIRNALEKQHLGGVILFAHNLSGPKQIQALTTELQEIATESGHFPLFISIDQEGGRVERVTEGTTLFPGALALGQTDSPDEVQDAAFFSGYDLNNLGINLILAPVLDVNNNPDNPVINTRSFGTEPERVSKIGIAYAKGLSQSGSTHCIKHFPGHGDTSVDSHYALPVIRKSEQELEEVELIPFRRAIEQGAEMVMTAHVIYTGVDRNQPATLSKKIVHGILREKLGFDGVVITDAMEMNAISRNFGPGEAAVRAIEAGVDIILLTAENPSLTEMIQSVLAAVQSGRIPEESLNASVERQIRLKLKKGIYPHAKGESSPFEPLFEAQKKEIQTRYNQLIKKYKSPGALNRTLSEKAVRSMGKVYPGLDQKDGRDLPTVVYSSSREISPEAFMKEVSRDLPKLKWIQVSGLEDAWKKIQKNQSRTQQASTVILEIGNREQRSWNRIVAEFETRFPKSRLIGVYSGNPFLVLSIPEKGALIASFSRTPQSIRAPFRILLQGKKIEKADLILK